MSGEEIVNILLSTGWKEYPNRFRPDSRMFCKSFQGRACPANARGGQKQLEAYVSSFDGRGSLEIECTGQLAGEMWVKILIYALKVPDDLNVAIEKALSIWNSAA